MSVQVIFGQILSAFRKDHPKPRENAFIMMRFNNGDQNVSICNSVRESLRECFENGRVNLLV